MEIGFGPLNLLPDVFWAMTPSEIFRLHDGYKWRDERAMERVAWQTTYLVNAHGNKFTVDQILGRESANAEQEEVDKEEEFEKLMELMEQKRNATL